MGLRRQDSKRGDVDELLLRLGVGVWGVIACGLWVRRICYNVLYKHVGRGY
jgi:hypothetical protein